MKLVRVAVAILVILLGGLITVVAVTSFEPSVLGVRSGRGVVIVLATTFLVPIGLWIIATPRVVRIDSVTTIETLRRKRTQGSVLVCLALAWLGALGIFVTSGIDFPGLESQPVVVVLVLGGVFLLMFGMRTLDRPSRHD